MVPADTPLLSEYAEREGEWPEPESLFHLPQNIALDSDGSGGERSQNPRLRRVGWSFVISEGEQVLPSCRSTVAGWRHTVPCAELAAVVRALQTSSGGATVVVDADDAMKKGSRELQ